MRTGNWTPDGGRKGQSHHWQRSQTIRRLLAPGVVGLSWHLHTGSPCSPGGPSQRQLELAGLGQLGMLVQDVPLPISPIYANAASQGLVCPALALSALLVPAPALRSQEGAASKRMQLSFHRPLASQGRATEGRAATRYLPWTWVPRCRTA